MAIGSSIITADGINALANASASGKSIKPKYFKFSHQDLILDPNLSAKDLIGWRTQNIDLYQKVSADTVEFVCDVIPTEATDYTRICGLFLEDGTLFMVAKPPYPFPPTLRQTFKIQMVYENATELLDFKYLSFSETEQDLSVLNTNVQMGLFNLQTQSDLESMKQRADAIYIKGVEDKKELTQEIESVQEVAHLEVLNSSATLGNLILDTHKIAQNLKI